MASFFDLQTGIFAGNCAPSSIPSGGQGYIDIDPTPGLNNPVWDGTAWQAGEPITEAPSGPDWDGLNLAIMADAAFNQAYAAVMQSHPLIAAALPAALTQVASGQTTMFATAFVAMCAAAEVTPAQRSAWADIGATFNAPAEFLDIVRGVGNV